MTKARPKLSDVQCSRMQFQDGDKVLVRTYTNLSKEQEHKLRKTVEKWAGDGIPVLIINGTMVEVTKLDREEQARLIYPGET